MTVHFEGDLTTRDCKRHIPHAFTLPDDCEQLDIHFSFAPLRGQGIVNLVTLTVFDPHGFRGAGHRSGGDHHVCLTAAEATPGYLPGPLPAGEWTVQLDTHMIMPGAPVHYRLDVTPRTEASRPPSAAAPPRPTPPQRGAGWYRGDLHTHTHHSDAANFTVADLLRLARAYRLDFVFLTDHNTISGLAEMEAAATPDLLTAGGIELTTFWGHALCLGARAWVDWRVRPDDDTMGRIAAATYASDQVFIIAHPQSDSDPGCTGCAWRYGLMMPGNARLVEIWNGPWRGDSNNEDALALWYDWLNQGWRLYATAGTDVHGSDHAGDAIPAFSVIYAEALTEAALLKALRVGHLYLSAGPELLLQARDAAGAIWMSGDTVSLPATFTASWARCPAGAQVRLIANGRLWEQRSVSEQGDYHWAITPEQAAWIVLELRDSAGDMLAVTNPIFLHPQSAIRNSQFAIRNSQFVIRNS